MQVLSDSSNRLMGQPMFQLLNKIQILERQGREIFHFELGDPDFDTPNNIIQSACYAITHGMTHYTNSQGMFEFREAIQKTTERTRYFSPKLSQILVTPGANSIIYYAIHCIANPGDDILVPNPGFPSYYAAASACGVNTISIPLYKEKKFVMQPEDVEKLITPRTKILILNTPSNPTGALIPTETMKQLFEVAKKHDLYVLSDEVYARLVYNNESFFSPSMLDQCQERTIIINGFSKSFSMTGWRLGVAIGPEILIRKMTLLNETIVSCVPPFVQYAGIEAIQGDQQYPRKMLEEYKKRIFYLAAELDKIPGLHCPTPMGSIYVFPDISDTGMTDEEFTNFALDKASIAVLPGTNFGKYGSGFVRFSCVTEIATIQRAMKHLRAALA